MTSKRIGLVGRKIHPLFLRNHSVEQNDNYLQLKFQNNGIRTTCVMCCGCLIFVVENEHWMNSWFIQIAFGTKGKIWRWRKIIAYLELPLLFYWKEVEKLPRNVLPHISNLMWNNESKIKTWLQMDGFGGVMKMLSYSTRVCANFVYNLIYVRRKE